MSVPSRLSSPAATNLRSAKLADKEFLMYIRICNRGVCLLRHNFMDTLEIKVLVEENKRMGRSNPYAYRYFLSLCRKTDAISILYTISISRSLPVILGEPPMIIRSISS